MALNIAELLLFLDLSPLGSLALPHVELKDFVVINKYELKLTDLDELEYEERECSQNSACDLKGTPVGKCFLFIVITGDSIFNLSLSSLFSLLYSVFRCLSSFL